MKKRNKNLSLKQMRELIEAAEAPGPGSKLIGFIGKMPCYSNPMVPEGVIYMLNDDFFKNQKEPLQK